MLPLQAAHAAELIPAGAEQRRHLAVPGNALGRVAPVFQGVAIATWRANAVSAAVHPAWPWVIAG
jgi:hypothetical protein